MSALAEPWWQGTAEEEKITEEGSPDSQEIQRIALLKRKLCDIRERTGSQDSETEKPSGSTEGSSLSEGTSSQPYKVDKGTQTDQESCFRYQPLRIPHPQFFPSELMKIRQAAQRAQGVYRVAQLDKRTTRRDYTDTPPADSMPHKRQRSSTRLGDIHAGPHLTLSLSPSYEYEGKVNLHGR